MLSLALADSELFLTQENCLHYFKHYCSSLNHASTVVKSIFRDYNPYQEFILYQLR